MNKMVTVAAILPNYNSSKFLATALNSLTEQTIAFDEIIIVDDGSTDTSLQIIESYLVQHATMRLIKHERNLGVCPALNTGIDAAKSDFFIMCAADDWYHPDLAAQIKKAGAQFPQVGIICGDAEVRRYGKASFRRGLPLNKNAFIAPPTFKKIAHKTHIGFNGGGVALNRLHTLAMGKLQECTRWHSDWLLYTVLAYQHGLYYTDQVFVYVNLRTEGYSEGRKNWRTQGPVIQNTVDVIHNHYPQLWQDFKSAALLPTYAPHYLKLLQSSANFKKFFTLKLFFRLLMNNALFTNIGRWLPYSFVLTLRKLLRA